MPIEKLLIYLVVGAILLVKFVADALQRSREHRMAQQAAHEPGVPEPGPYSWEPRRDAGPSKSRTDAASSRVVPQPRTLERSSPRPAHPSQPQSPQRPRGPMRVEPATRHRIALRDPAELRRAMELMAILGPPRSRAPDNS